MFSPEMVWKKATTYTSLSLDLFGWRLAQIGVPCTGNPLGSGPLEHPRRTHWCASILGLGAVGVRCSFVSLRIWHVSG